MFESLTNWLPCREKDAIIPQKELIAYVSAGEATSVQVKSLEGPHQTIVFSRISPLDMNFCAEVPDACVRIRMKPANLGAKRRFNKVLQATLR